MGKTPSIDELSDLTIDDAKPHLAKLSPEQLQLLRAKEVEKGEDKARSTFLHLIDVELGKHDDADEAEGEDVDAADPQPAPSPASLTADPPTASPSEHPTGRGPSVEIDGEEYLAAELEKLGYARDGGPIDATFAQKAIFALTGVTQDRDRLRSSFEDDGTDWKSEALGYRAVLDEIGGGLGGGAFERPSGLIGATVIYDKLPMLVAERLEQGRRALDDHSAAQARVIDLEQEKALGVAPEGAPIADHTHIAVVATPAELALRFLDRGAETLVPDVPVSALDVYQRSADTVIYERPLDFAPSVPAFTLTAVALVDAGGRVIDTCQVIPAMAVGGGRSVQLPAGTLMFRQPQVSAARAA